MPNRLVSIRQTYILDLFLPPAGFKFGVLNLLRTKCTGVELL